MTRGRRRTAGAARQDRAGFVLAEALVAFAILAIGLGLVAAGLASALRADGRAASARAALREAQALLARAGLTEPLAPSDRRGGEPGGTRWHVTIARVAPSGPGPDGGRTGPVPASPRAAPAPPVAFWVEVTVWTPDGARAALAELKLGPAT